MSRLRVLHVGCVTDPSRRPGAELLDAWRTIPAVAAAVRDAGADVTVLQAAHVDERVDGDGIPFHFIAESPLARLPGTRGPAGVLPRRLARAAAALDPDLIHLNGLAFPLHARALALTGRPVLAQDHSDLPPTRWRPIHAWGYSRITGAAFTAAEQAEPFFRTGVLPRATPIFEVPESSTDFTPGDRAAARAATGVCGDPALLWIGRLDANKDPLTVLDAVRRVTSDLPGVRLWCCFGDAPLLPAVRDRLLGDPELAARVTLLGRVPRDRVQLLCRAADFMVLPSRREASSFAVLEALACGCTPILSDIPAFKALTGDGTVGSLVPPGDPEALARAILALGPRRGPGLRRRAVDHFRRELSFPALGARLLAAYESVIGTRRAVEVA